MQEVHRRMGGACYAMVKAGLTFDPPLRATLRYMSSQAAPQSSNLRMRHTGCPRHGAPANASDFRSAPLPPKYCGLCERRYPAGPAFERLGQSDASLSRARGERLNVVTFQQPA